MLTDIDGCAPTGVGSLPFTDAAKAAEHVSEHYEVPFCPQLGGHDYEGYASLDKSVELLAFRRPGGRSTLSPRSGSRASTRPISAAPRALSASSR